MTAQIEKHARGKLEMTIDRAILEASTCLSKLGVKDVEGRLQGFLAIPQNREGAYLDREDIRLACLSETLHDIMVYRNKIVTEILNSGLKYASPRDQINYAFRRFLEDLSYK